MVKKIFLLLVLLVLLNGCATKVSYYKPNNSYQQYEKDLYNCEMAAREQLALEGTNPSSISGVFFLQPKITECMKKRYGYKVIGK